ncbi:MAG: hypothetical protein J6C64_00630 [Lachnospiraceae bacterium]|nr:hypothetical protein [Lachnospiraceae bacterium]
MELSETLNHILYIVLTAVLPLIATYTVNLIKAKIKESSIISDTIKNDTMNQLVTAALSDVMDAVLYVNQVYTDSLKANGRFDEISQKEAFNRAYAEAMNMISDKAKKAIEQLYGSFDKWLQLKIEASVNAAKKL